MASFSKHRDDWCHICGVAAVEATLSDLHEPAAVAHGENAKGPSQ